MTAMKESETDLIISLLLFIASRLSQELRHTELLLAASIFYALSSLSLRLKGK